MHVHVNATIDTVRDPMGCATRAGPRYVSRCRVHIFLQHGHREKILQLFRSPVRDEGSPWRDAEGPEGRAVGRSLGQEQGED